MPHMIPYEYEHMIWICTYYDMHIWYVKHYIKISTKHTLAKLHPLNIFSLPIAKNAVTTDKAVEKNSPPNIKVNNNWNVYEKRFMGSLAMNAVVVCEYCNCVEMFVGRYCIWYGNWGTNDWCIILLGCMMMCRAEDDGMNAVMMYVLLMMLWYTTNSKLLDDVTN